MATSQAPSFSLMESYIEGYVLHKTGHNITITIYGNKDVVIKDEQNGSGDLADFWTEVLQDSKNFPWPANDDETYYYTVTDYNVKLKLNGLTIIVARGTGTLRIKGINAPNWFLENLRNILASYVIKNKAILKGVQDYSTSFHMDKAILNQEELDDELEDVKQGAMLEGSTSIYRLWLSLLNSWFAEKGNNVYIVSPFMDTDRLEDIVKLYTWNKPMSCIQKLVIREKCDSYEKEDAEDIKEDVLKRFPGHYGRVIQQGVYQKIVHPEKRFHGKWIATVMDGVAQILVTSANFSGAHFKHQNMETVVFIDHMEEEMFNEKYIDNFM